MSFTKIIFEEYQINIVKQNINIQKLTAHLFTALAHIKLDEPHFNSKELKKHTKYLTASTGWFFSKDLLETIAITKVYGLDIEVANRAATVL